MRNFLSWNLETARGVTGKEYFPWQEQWWKLLCQWATFSVLRVPLWAKAQPSFEAEDPASLSCQCDSPVVPGWKITPAFRWSQGYFANYPFRSSLPLFPKEGTLEANITTFSLANISIHSYHSEYVVWSQRQSDLPARNFLRDCPLHCSFLQLSFGVWLKLPFSLVFTLGYFTRKLLF